jgi:hypothetical protein
MNYKSTADGAAIVAPNIKWLKIDASTPLNTRMQLIEKAQGVAYTRVHHEGDGFDHWFPVPTFEEEAARDAIAKATGE